MKRVKLIALDMDGTLLDGGENVPPANREAISLAQQQGVHVVLSTGRFITSTRRYAHDLGLTSYLVTSNGGEIWSPSQELLERHTIATELVEWMLGLGKQYSTRYWGATTDAVWNWENFPADVYVHEWLKFGFDTPNDRVREQIWESLLSTGKLELSNSSPTNIEVNARNINKATALSKVCTLLGFSMDNVLAVGDSLNDLAMIRSAGCGVAMGNAQDRVKAEADWVTGTNEEDGVAQAIHRWVLEKTVP